jgi:hypothetical protein
VEVVAVAEEHKDLAVQVAGHPVSLAEVLLITEQQILVVGAVEPTH